MNGVRALKERADSSEALATASPPVQEHHVTSIRVAQHLIDQAGSVALVALGLRDSRQRVACSLSRRFREPDRRPAGCTCNSSFVRVAIVVPGGVDSSGRHRVIPSLLSFIARLAANHDVVVYVLRYH